MKVRFLQDYRGVLTEEVFYREGDEAVLEYGSDLVDQGRAVAVMVKKPKSKAPERKRSGGKFMASILAAVPFMLR